MFKAYNSDPFKKRVADFCICNYALIPQEKIIKPSFALSNKGCSMNAVAAFNGGRADAVWLVMAGNNDHMVVHFINSKAGVFFDETWGTNDNYYRIIRKIQPNEHAITNAILMATKRNFYSMLGDRRDKIAMKKDIDDAI